MAALSMCPIEDEVAPPRRQVRPGTVGAQEAVPVMEEDTECNYLILFFIVGVIILALMDAT
jgi:hypothetical protein